MGILGKLVKTATRKGQYARIALAGPSGSGKTYSTLLMLDELSGDEKFLLIDTERGAAGLYSDNFDFDIIDWVEHFGNKFDPRDLIKVLEEAQEEYTAIGIDSMTHFYQGKGGLIDIANNNKKGKNEWSGWAVATPIQTNLYSTILTAGSHIVCAVRSKQETVLEKNDKGYQEVVRKGMKAVQRDDFIYEMTVYGEIDLDHKLKITKTRFDGIDQEVCTSMSDVTKMTKKIGDWLNSAEGIKSTSEMLEDAADVIDSSVASSPITAGQVSSILLALGGEEASNEAKNAFFGEFGKPTEVTGENYEKALATAKTLATASA